MTERQTPHKEEVVEIPQEVTRESFSDRLTQARRQRPGQVLFSSVRGDRFVGEAGDDVSLVNAAILMGFRLLEDHVPGTGEATISEPDIEGARTVVEHWDLGDGYGVRIEKDAKVPHATSNEPPQVSRLVVVTELAGQQEVA